MSLQYLIYYESENRAKGMVSVTLRKLQIEEESHWECWLMKKKGAVQTCGVGSYHERLSIDDFYWDKWAHLL